MSVSLSVSLSGISHKIFALFYVPACLYICLYICLHVCFYACLSDIYACLSVFMSVCMSVFMPVCIYACQSDCLSVCLPVCLSINLSVCLYACMQVGLYASLYLCLPVCLSIYLSVCRRLSLCLSVCLHGYRHLSSNLCPFFVVPLVCFEASHKIFAPLLPVITLTPKSTSPLPFHEPPVTRPKTSADLKSNDGGHATQSSTRTYGRASIYKSSLDEPPYISRWWTSPHTCNQPSHQRMP